MSITAEMYLEHHGIPGMKWGKKNGPPYPLNYNDLSEAEKSEAKSKAIRDGNIKEASANRSHFTDQELRDVMTRFDLNTRLTALVASQTLTGMQKLDKYSKSAETVSSAIERSGKLYNSVAKVVNSFSDNELPIIGQQKQQKEEKKAPKITDSATIDDIIKNPDKYSDDDVKAAVMRKNNLKILKSN